MNWRLKLSNWLSGGALYKCQEQAKLAKARVQQIELQTDSLQERLEQAEKKLTQANAQLQISQGFQIELGETQIQLKKMHDKYSSCHAKLLTTQKQLERSQSELQKTTTELAKSQNWLEQINTPVEIFEIEKTLPKHEFNSFWGFGISSPQPHTITTTGSIIVRGWILGKKSPIELVKAIYREQTIAEVPVNNPSPSITQQYPDIPQAANSGFEFPLTVAGLVLPAELNLVAVLSDRSVIPLCVFVLK